MHNAVSTHAKINCDLKSFLLSLVFFPIQNHEVQKYPVSQGLTTKQAASCALFGFGLPLTVLSGQNYGRGDKTSQHEDW